MVWRIRMVLAGVVLVSTFLLWRAFDIQVMNNEFLQSQGDARHLRTVKMPAHRGNLLDRNGEPLAISTPVASVWANPIDVKLQSAELKQLAKLLEKNVQDVRQSIQQKLNEGKSFVYLKRQIDPTLAQQIKALQIPGIGIQREYRRYYPTAEVSAHVVGFTDVDDQGQEGMELSLEQNLSGEPGQRRVIKDRIGRIIDTLALQKSPMPGTNIRLSIDRRLQYLAYKELKSAVQQHKAKSGSVVVLDVDTGEVLALVNQPSFNPNNRQKLKSDEYRNRAVTDVLEPGSTMKPFTIAAALSAKLYNPGTQINTTPGYYTLMGKTIRDFRNYGLIDVATIIQKSSNVGVSKMALQMDRELLWNAYSDYGFGRATNSDYPGEISGVLPFYSEWDALEQATMSYGYGLSVTPLQLAQAYAMIAAGGVLRPVSFVATVKAKDETRVLDKSVALQVGAMLELVTSNQGTAAAAQVKAYRVAGKTGTVHKPQAGGYAEDRYIALFAGFAPASQPKLVCVVVINEPSGKDYYGGKVAAPVFSSIMQGGLRFVNAPPDGLINSNVHMAKAGAG
ncbi:MAG: penicillin-binding transpeptidase domain-containing protein [Gammaproteobacteria bacterium]|nr:penicillin-binding transpeptidase domain-containing protein [Gammaproteobacteria bacterium]MDH5728102.1 penicillin-binding transpeptidase domain-containing protein [Gammaproteobacteria bacterium]